MRGSDVITLTRLDCVEAPSPACGRGNEASASIHPHATFSFFCRLEEEVVYWKVSRFSG